MSLQVFEQGVARADVGVMDWAGGGGGRDEGKGMVREAGSMGQAESDSSIELYSPLS